MNLARLPLALLLTAGLALSTPILSGCKGDASANSGRTADRAAAKRAAFEITTTSAGELEARNKVEIRNKLERQTTITKIVAEGTRAKAGDVLVELNAEDIQKQVNDESLQVESSKAALISAENAYRIQINENDSRMRDARLKLDLAKLALQHWFEGDVKIKRQENLLNINKANLETERLAEKFVRSQELLVEGFVSKDECDRDEVAYIEAISRWNTTLLQADVYEKYLFPKEFKEKQSAVDEAEAAIERTVLNNDSELASKDAARKNQQQQLIVREQNLAKLREQLEAAVIRAPREGLVVYATSVGGGWRWNGDNSMQVGTQVSPNETLIILPDTSDMVASIKVQESLAGRIKPGQDVSVKVEAVGGRVFVGKVDTISVLAESGGWRDPNVKEYTVKVALDVGEAKDLLKPSMRCEARVTLGRVEDAVTVPVQAVFQDGPVRFVHVESDGMSGKFRRLPIRLGRVSDTQAEIVKGLDDGIVVLLREPAAGEILANAWDRAELELAGYSIGDNGEPTGDLPGAGPSPSNPTRIGRARSQDSATKSTQPATEATPTAAITTPPTTTATTADSTKPAETPTATATDAKAKR